MVNIWLGREDFLCWSEFLQVWYHLSFLLPTRLKIKQCEILSRFPHFFFLKSLSFEIPDTENLTLSADLNIIYSVVNSWIKLIHIKCIIKYMTSYSSLTLYQLFLLIENIQLKDLYITIKSKISWSPLSLHHKSFPKFYFYSFLTHVFSNICILQ